MHRAAAVEAVSSLSNVRSLELRCLAELHSFSGTCTTYCTFSSVTRHSESLDAHSLMAI